MSETAQRKHICARVGVPLCRLDRRHEAELQTAKDIYNAQMQEGAWADCVVGQEVPSAMMSCV